jgi:hypothetical protein
MFINIIASHLPEAPKNPRCITASPARRLAYTTQKNRDPIVRGEGNPTRLHNDDAPLPLLKEGLVTLRMHDLALRYRMARIRSR